MSKGKTERRFTGLKHFHYCEYPKLTYEALVIGYGSDFFVNIIQYGFRFVSSCLDLRRKEDFLSFLLLPFQRHFNQQNLYMNVETELKTGLERWLTVCWQQTLLQSDQAYLPHRLWLCIPLSSGWLDSLDEWQQQTHPRGCPRCPCCWLFLSPDKSFYTTAICCGEASLKHKITGGQDVITDVKCKSNTKIVITLLINKTPAVWWHFWNGFWYFIQLQQCKQEPNFTKKKKN